MTSPYTISQARNYFALWAAYRAAQAGGAKANGKQFIEALKTCGVIAFMRNPANHSITREKCEEKFHLWVSKAQKHLSQKSKRSVNYGIVAKLVSVYFKSAFVLCGYHETLLAFHMPPPIDSKLLKGIDEKHHTKFHNEYKWKSLGCKRYKELLGALRPICGDENPFWYLDKYWNP